jgi:hypothetical protein
MPDFDVAVNGLTSPPAAAPVTAYTPALSVTNTGLPPAAVTGVMRVYQRNAPGELLFTLSLTPKTIAAGATADVYTALQWTPTIPEIGTSYIFTADITAANDQVEQNNHLSPTTVTVVSGAPPPPPPVVSAHASQHELGGTDELSVEGLPGELAADQPPKDHAGKHEIGGADELNVAGLPGVLAQSQTPKAHANEAHSVAFASSTEIATEIGQHDTDNTAHDSSTLLEKNTNKGRPDGYAALDADGYLDGAAVHLIYPQDVQALRHRDYGDPYAGIATASHIHRGGGGLCARTLYTCTSSEVVFMKKAYPAAFFGTAAYYTLDISIGFLIQATAGDVLTFYVRAAAAAALIGTIAITMPGLGANTPGHMRMLIAMLSGATNAVPHYSANVRWSTLTPGAIGGANAAGAGTAFAHAGAGDITVAAKWTGAAACVLQVARLTESCDLVDDNV